MPVNLNLDTKANAVRDLTASATGFASKVIDFVLAFKSDANPFGSAALKDAGSGAGQVPLLDASGKLLPAAIPASFATQTWTKAQLAAAKQGMATEAYVRQQVQASTTRLEQLWSGNLGSIGNRARTISLATGKSFAAGFALLHFEFATGAPTVNGFWVSIPYAAWVLSQRLSLGGTHTHRDYTGTVARVWRRDNSNFYFQCFGGEHNVSIRRCMGQY